MRKFEQEAIVNQIIKTIKSKFEKETETFKTKKEYQAIVKINADIQQLEDKLAIALLGSEWKDNLPAIMEEIANQF